MTGASQEIDSPSVAGGKAGRLVASGKAERLPGRAEERIEEAFANLPPPRLTSRFNRYWTPSASIVGLTSPGTLPAWRDALVAGGHGETAPGPHGAPAPPPWRQAVAEAQPSIAATALTALPWDDSPASLKGPGSRAAFSELTIHETDGDSLQEIAPDPTVTAGIPVPNLPLESPLPTPRPNEEPVAAVARPARPEPPAAQPEAQPKAASLPPAATRQPAPEPEAQPSASLPEIEAQGDQDEPAAAITEAAPELPVWEERQFDAGSTPDLPASLRPTRPPAQ